MDEMIAHDLPGKAVVLIEPVVGRMHDLIVFFMLHEHADDRRLRQHRVDTACNALVSRRLADVPGKAGTVIVMDGNNALLDRTVALDGAVNGKVAALGVSSDADRLVRVLARHTRNIRNGLLLRGDLLQKAHIEVFLPPNDRIVCAAE